jgi:predicted permease
VVAVILTIAAATAAGVWAERRWAARAADASRRMMLFVLYVVLPPATFFNLTRAEIDADVGIGIGLAWVALGVTTLLAYAVASRLLRLPRPAIGSVLCCTIVANTGYLGYPLVAVLLGFDRLSEAVVYDILVAAPALLLGAFSVGAAFGTRAGEGPRERVVAFFTRNPALYAAALAIVAPDSLAPDVLVDASRIAIVAILPLGFFAVGTALASEAEEGALPVPPPLDASVAATVAMRLAVAPALLYLIALPVIDLPGSYLLLAAMPCGINTVIVTHAYGLDLRITAASVAWSTVVAVVVAGVASAFA